MLENDFLTNVKGFVFDLFKNKLPVQAVYHNFEHTTQVVEAVYEIATAKNISDDDMEILLLAAWFHDTGFTKGFENHEEKSKIIADTYLSNKRVPKDKINKILRLIDATKMPQNPTNKIEEIICDADLFHLGEENFKEKGNLLRRERENIADKNITDIEWFEENVIFLSNHRYFSEYAFKKLNAQKRRNRMQIQKDLKMAIAKSEELELKAKTKDDLK